MSLLFPIKALCFFQSKDSRNGTNGRPLPTYLFIFFVQTFPSSSSLRAITVAPVIFPQRKQNYLKRDPNGYCSQTACRGTCSLPVVIPSVCVCVHENPPVCVCVRTRLAKHDTLGVWTRGQTRTLVQQRDFKPCMTKIFCPCIFSQIPLCQWQVGLTQTWTQLAPGKQTLKSPVLVACTVGTTGAGLLVCNTKEGTLCYLFTVQQKNTTNKTFFF